MVTTAERRERAAREVAALSRRGLRANELLRRAEERLAPVIGFAGAGWLTTDPATLLFTGGVITNLPEATCHPFFANELLTDDVAKFRDLARARRPVASLACATGGRLERSSRYREVYAPYGFGDELRVALVRGGRCWGAAMLVRETSDRPFSQVDADLLARAAPHIADGLRTALLLAACDQAAADGPGVVLLDRDGTLVAMSGEAQRWLDDVDDGLTAKDAFVGADAVSVVAAAARASAAGLAPGPPRLRLRTRSGRWLVLHGTCLGDDRTAVIVGAAEPADVAAVVVAAYGLSDRERDVLAAVARGAGTAAIARTLHLSPHTVRDHVKSLFSKVGVSSRGELVATVFAAHYLPRLLASTDARHA